jgi:predicted chitinase/GNAT superfamily N-acetyltransferase
MRLREFAPSLDRNNNDDVPDPIFVLANRWWNATDRQPQIEHVLNSLGWSIHQVESEDDAVQLQHRDGTTYFISADDFDPDLFEYQEPGIQRANRDGIDLSFEKIKDDEYVSDDDDENIVAQVTATSNGKELGHVLFSIDGNTLLPQDLEVDERYRGQGVAKIMYDYVKSLGYQIRRSGQQTDAGAGFWSKHRPSQNVWETELDEGWKDVAAGVAAAGAMALGSPQADAKPTPTAGPSIQQQASMSPVDKLRTAATANGIRGTELAQFLAQCAHESANFNNMEEIGNANYFAKKYDPKYAPKTAKILGNVKPGDGERYKGRGFIQLTGRDNYTRAGKALGLPLADNPALAARPDVAAMVAVWYWKNRVASKVKNFHNTKQVTRAINPASKGLQSRQDQFKAYQVAQR